MFPLYESCVPPAGPCVLIQRKAYLNIYLLELWDEAYEETKDTDAKARMMGVAMQMNTFEFYYGVSLAHLLLRHTDNLSRTLQHKNISAAAGQQVAKKALLQHCRACKMILTSLFLGSSERKISIFKH